MELTYRYTTAACLGSYFLINDREIVDLIFYIMAATAVYHPILMYVASRGEK